MTDIVRTKAQVGRCYPGEDDTWPMIAGEAIEAGQPVFLDATTKKAKRSDANGAGVLASVHGLACHDAAAGQPVQVIKRGAVYGFTLDGDVGEFAYVSDTIGELADAASATTPLPVGMIVCLTDSPTLTKVLYVDITWAYRDFVDDIA